jgi:hypothetical protein
MPENADKSIHLTQQWLAEIQFLRQQMTELRHQRDEAWASSQKWCQLYNIEAEQRRTESQSAQQMIATVQAKLHQMQGRDVGVDIEVTSVASIQAEISQITTLEELHFKLITLTQERDHLLQALKIEQESHAQTRKSLTTALGDAIDSLAKARGAGEAGEQGSSPAL